MALADEISSVIRDLQNELGNPSFIWKGEYIPCVPQSLLVGATLAFGGFDVPITYRLFVRVADWTTVDETIVLVDSTLLFSDNGSWETLVGQKLQYRSQTLRIGSVKVSACQSYAIVDCIDKNR